MRWKWDTFDFIHSIFTLLIAVLQYSLMLHNSCLSDNNSTWSSKQTLPDGLVDLTAILKDADSEDKRKDDHVLLEERPDGWTTLN